MAFSLTVNSGLYKVAAQQLIREKRADAKLLLREESRLLLRDILAYTPPKTKSQGQKAIAGDIGRVYESARGVIKEVAEKGNGVLARALVQTLKENDFRGFNDLLMGATGSTVQVNVRSYRRGGERVSGYRQSRPALRPNFPRWAGGVISTNVDPSLHLRRRNTRGRINGQKLSQIVTDPKSIKDYRKTITDRVGWARAGWNAAARAVGFQQPQYVAALPAKGGFVEVSGPNFSVTLTNDASKIPNYQRTVNDALNRRFRSFISEVARIVAGGKSRRASLGGTSAGAAE